MNNQEYLAELITELVEDDSWDFPQEGKEMLYWDINWTLLDL